MAQNPIRTCSVRFNDGDSLKFRFEAVKGDDDPTFARNLKELTEAKNFVFQLEDRLILIPATSVRSIEVYPAPKNLPQDFIKGVITG